MGVLNILNTINSPEDVKKLDKEQLPELCEEIRKFLIDNVSKTGGHLSANLGVVELTVAIHRVFDTAQDRLVFDVGHQSYVHKILTGRREKFNTLRQYGGIAGFPKPSESVHDAFIAGHASNSISVALGMARARTLRKEDYNVIAMIGDGALTGGLSYEALNDAGDSGEPIIVILNDNGMAITPNVGAISRHLAHQRIKPGYLSFKKFYRKITQATFVGRKFYKFTHGIKTAFKEAILHCSMFEEMGFQYLGPVDGHDIGKLTDVLSWAKELDKPALIHVITKKGKGYIYSEENPDEYHGVSKFDAKKGIISCIHSDFSSVFGSKLSDLAGKDERICAITAAMTSGTGLSEFAVAYPKRFFDVGIAEEHAVAMAAGAAKCGMVPVFAVYSTFLQRAYDMLIHDVSIDSNHVVFAVDRAGLVGRDGETHHGVFDVSYLTSVPNMTVMVPSSYKELGDMLEFAVERMNGPVAIRYPRGTEGRYKEGGMMPSKLIRSGSDFTIITYGTMINTALDVSDALASHGIETDILKLDFINPIDFESVKRSAIKTGRVLVLEECVESGCVGQKIAANLAESGIFLKSLILKNLGNRFITHGDTDVLLEACGLDTESVIKNILEELVNE